ncbi:hypothetical protein BKG77_01635 [Mycobacteroides chelonae]|uniref:DJ-1/PfpI family protein n=1 Tax=Mycobacteroides chelonae TaxID=1774 RepID=UPI0008A9F140|nr:DJ-1/PfpI family protein [Mycobacteroides chelonae]OHU28269.1 hypothetical protein BKG77_01635 [Mycobacteroides chelonae]
MATQRPLKGTEIGVFIESDYIYREIHYYVDRFAEEGAVVRLITRLWSSTPPTFTDHDFHIPLDLPIEDLRPFLGEGLAQLDALIIPGGFVSDRLRYSEVPGGIPPALELLRQAFGDKRIVKGIICHGLWLSALLPELIAGRPVTCHNNLVGDARNMGAHYTDSDLVDDGDLVTARTADHHQIFTAELIDKLRSTKGLV